MSKQKTFIYPKELENASNQVKHDYKLWIEKSEELENHPLRYYTVTDYFGDVQRIDCTGIWKINWKRLRNFKVEDQEHYDEVKRRGQILQKLKNDKGLLNRKWNIGLTGKSGNKNVLDFKKGDILEAFGRYKNLDEVMALIKEWGFNVSVVSLNKFYGEHLDDIKDRRMRFSASAKDYYLATEAGRVETLSALFVRLKELFDETDNVKYASEIRAIVEQVRKEVKGDEIKLTVDGKIDLTATLQANRTLIELNQRLSVNSFIIGLVAAKKGVNPGDIQAQLASSFYSNYNGFGKLSEDEIKLPSNLISSYDWKEIEQIHTQKEQKASKMMLEKELAPIWKKNGINYNGNIQESLKELEMKLGDEVVTEIVDVKPLEVEVVKEKKEDIKSKRDILKDILSKKKNNLGGID